jgi:hypothetical protein
MDEREFLRARVPVVGAWLGREVADRQGRRSHSVKDKHLTRYLGTGCIFVLEIEHG